MNTLKGFVEQGLFPCTLHWQVFWSDTADYVSFKFCWHSLFSQDLLPRKKRFFGKKPLRHFQNPQEFASKNVIQKISGLAAWFKKKRQAKCKTKKTHHSFYFLQKCLGPDIFYEFNTVQVYRKAGILTHL